MSTAESASAKMPPGPEPPAMRRHLAAMASTWLGSMPMVSRASPSTAARSAGVSAPPKKVRPMPDQPLVGAELEQHELARVGGRGQADHQRDCRRACESARVVTWVIFISCACR